MRSKSKVCRRRPSGASQLFPALHLQLSLYQVSLPSLRLSGSRRPLITHAGFMSRKARPYTLCSRSLLPLVKRRQVSATISQKPWRARLRSYGCPKPPLTRPLSRRNTWGIYLQCRRALWTFRHRSTFWKLISSFQSMKTTRPNKSTLMYPHKDLGTFLLHRWTINLLRGLEPSQKTRPVRAQTMCQQAHLLPLLSVHRLR